MFVEHRQYGLHESHFGSPGETDGDDASGGDEGSGSTLEDAARDEREYVRERLREELGRQPSDEEMDEWLREHTEGY